MKAGILKVWCKRSQGSFEEQRKTGSHVLTVSDVKTPLIDTHFQLWQGDQETESRHKTSEPLMCTHITLRDKLANGRQLGKKMGTVFPENSTGKIFMTQRVVNWDMILKCILEGIRETWQRTHTCNILRTPMNEQDSIVEKWAAKTATLWDHRHHPSHPTSQAQQTEKCSESPSVHISGPNRKDQHSE